MFKLDDLAFGQKSYLNAVFSGFYRGCGLFGFSHFAMGAVPSGTRSFHSLTQRLRAGLSYSAPRAALALLDKLVPRQALGCSFIQNPRLRRDVRHLESRPFRLGQWFCLLMQC